MKPIKSRSFRIFSALKNKVNLFYILSFVPLLLISYYDLWILVIAFYGFIFLLSKYQKLQPVEDPALPQRILGIILIISSFFVHYALMKVLPKAGYYGVQNYIIFLLGLFLTFFNASALRETFTPLFFMAAATSSSIVADWLKPFLSPYLDNIAYIIVGILNTIGVNASVYNSSSAPNIAFRSASGTYIYASFVYECVGVFSALVFSIILIIVLFEDSSSWRARLAASIIGVTGTFALNIGRVTIILLADYFYGAEAGANVHYVIGYGLFSAWLILFLYVYSKREAIQKKLKLHRRDQSQLETDSNQMKLP
jgi:exosortase/archaeosortase family protein